MQLEAHWQTSWRQRTKRPCSTSWSTFVTHRNSISTPKHLRDFQKQRSRRSSLDPSLLASLEESLGYTAASPGATFATSTAYGSMRQRQRSRASASASPMVGGEAVEPEVLNERAVRVIRRVTDKLTGKEFGEELPVSAQVQRLIEAATSHQNLCQCFVGWCPFW